MKGDEVARKELEREVPELDLVRLGLDGLGPLESLPAGDTELVP